MYVLPNWTFTPGPAGEGTVEVPGLYDFNEFAVITNLARNVALFDPANPVLDTTWEQTLGGTTILTLSQSTSFCESSDPLQILMNDQFAGTSPEPSANVAVTNWPTSQNVSGSVTIDNDPLNPFSVSVSNFPSSQAVTGTFWQAIQPVSGSVSVSNFPATQVVSGSVSVSNFPSSQAVTGTFWQATQPVSGSVSVSNFPTTQPVSGSVSVSNFPATQPVSGSVTANQGTSPWVTSVNNFPATQPVSGTFWQTTQPVSGSVSVSNFPVTQAISGSVSVGNFPATQPVSGSVAVNNFPITQPVSGTFWQATQPVSGSVSVSNFPISQAVTGAFYQATQPVSGSVSVSNFPATQPVSGAVTANQGTSPWVVSGTTSSNVASFPSTSVDAFGRLRVSEPFTLFDSSFRYGDTGLWSTATATGGAAVYNAPQGLMDLNVTTTSGSSVRRQTTKVFSYQPGKPLLVMTTFVCAAPKANLNQKIGYYGSDNGYFLEQDGLTTYFVERSAVSGAVTNTRVAQSAWNVDKMDGTGPSGITLDISKAQILWMDLEWLGVGTVQMGFVINRIFYICHVWDHANLITSTYITTASLPLSCEITNTGATASVSTFKQICATVISEGGYALTGLQQSVGTPVTTAKTLTTAGTFYPIVSIRLKTTRLDAIAILTAISIQGTGNNNVFRWEVRAAGTSTAGAWVSAGADSSVEYNLTGTGYTGGRILAAGFTSSSNQGTPTINILREALFTFQLERDAFTATPYEITITVAGATGGTSCYASMDWEEVSR